jgi:hypothetical protein
MQHLEHGAGPGLFQGSYINTCGGVFNEVRRDQFNISYSNDSIKLIQSLLSLVLDR